MKYAQEVTHPAVADATAVDVGRLISRDQVGIFKLRRVQGWTAVPAEGNCHLNALDITRLARTYSEQGHHRVFAVRVEKLLDEPVAFLVDSSSDGLGEMDHRWASFNYVLCPDDLSSIVVCSTDDFLVFAGPQSFVESATGGSSPATLEAFRAYGARIGKIWPRMPAFVERIYLALAEDYPKAEVGTWVEFPRAEPKS